MLLLLLLSGVVVVMYLLDLLAVVCFYGRHRSSSRGRQRSRSHQGELCNCLLCSTSFCLVDYVPQMIWL
jgi:hypothetical protein